MSLLPPMYNMRQPNLEHTHLGKVLIVVCRLIRKFELGMG